jgi:hypothetical protein
LQNVAGILLGEALTAARETARPLVSKEVLAQWASKQANLISNSVRDEERQALSAEVVLECGGDVGDLKVIRWGSNWLSSTEFEERLRLSSEIAISFSGEFEYDEDDDKVHPKEFRDDFELSGDIAVVFRSSGSILSNSGSSWPRSLTGRSDPKDSRVAEHIRSIVGRVWGAEVEEDKKYCEVGTIGYTSIMRRVSFFTAGEDHEEETEAPEKKTSELPSLLDFEW